MSFRAERVEQLIKTEMTEIIQYELNDPRFPEIFSITDVKISPDLSSAKIYFTQMPEDDDSIDATYETLDRAKGFLRSELGNRIQLKHVPELAFYYDEMQQKSARIEELLQQSKAKESEKES